MMIGEVDETQAKPAAAAPTRPRLLVLNQYYWPGVEATANLLTELCGALADTYDITVVTGTVPGAEPGRFVRNSVRVVRVPSTAFDRARISRRALNYFTYVGIALWEGLRAQRPDVVMCMTDPPFVGDIAYVIARRFRVPLLVLSQDVFPEIAVRLDRLRNPAVISILRILTNYYLRRADRVAVLGDAMRRRIEAKGVEPGRISVIPNWGDVSAITPQPRDNGWTRANGLADAFVVMHFGNVGHAQDLDTLIHATMFLRDLDDLVVPIVGVGARRQELMELAARLDADKVLFLPWQPYEQRAEPIAAAHVHVVGLARGLAGYVVPSRIYGVLAAGRPVIASAEDESETAETVRRAGCGVVVPPGRPDLLAGAIRDARNGRYDLEEMGKRGREWVEREASRDQAVKRYRALLTELAGTHG